MERQTYPEIEHSQRLKMERGEYSPNVLVLRPKITLEPRLHESESSTFTSLFARLYSLLRRTDDRLFSRDPFTDIRRAVPEFCSVQFAQRQEFYGLSIDKKNVFKIDSRYASFLFEQAPKEINILPCNLSADVQGQKTRSDDNPIDSAGHSRVTFEVLFLAFLKLGLQEPDFLGPHPHKCKACATRNTMRTKGQRDDAACRQQG